ncbi:MAG: hypothetical protein EPN20_02155, partial [Magnetospirillum sp.]
MHPRNGKTGRPLFIGSKPFGLAILRSLRGVDPQLGTAITIDDSPDIRSCLCEFRNFAVREGLELVVASSAAEVKAEILARRPSVILVCGYYWLLDADVLNAVPGGIFGIHNSLLPRYRGSSPLVWAMINGESRVGSSLFALGEGMDDGPILHQIELDVASDEGIGSVLARLEAQLIHDLPALWPRLCAGTIERRPQIEAQATYCGRRHPQDGEIDWALSAGRIHNLVRAQAPPYPGAFTIVGGQRVTLLRTSSFQFPYFAVPGQVVRRRPGAVIVACGDNTALVILEAAVEGLPGDVDKLIGPGPLR